MDSVNGSVVAKVVRGLGGRNDEQVEPRGFVGQLNTLYDTIMTLTQHFSFVQTLRMYHTKTLGDYDVPMQVHQL